MIIWRFKYKRGPQLGGTQHAFTAAAVEAYRCSRDVSTATSLCGRARVDETTGHVPGYKTLPGPRCTVVRKFGEPCSFCGSTDCDIARPMQTMTGDMRLDANVRENIDAWVERKHWEKTVERLEAALRKYGRHVRCAKSWRGHYRQVEDIPAEHQSCTCGRRARLGR